jgi:hypothetical protein
MFTKLKAALAHFFDLGEDEVHEVVTALEADAGPMLAQLRKDIVADFVQAFAEGKVDVTALAAEIAKLLASGDTPAS